MSTQDTGAKKNGTVGDIVICDPPIIADRYDFLLEHLDCDCIVDKSDEERTQKVRVIAYSPSKKNNRMLREYFRKRGFGGQYRILQGIDSQEVYSIDDYKIS